MLAGIVGRDAELEAIDHFLDQVGEGPTGLLLEGVAGIGKSTLWLAAASEARRRGFRVLSCRPVASEAQLSYAGLADLLVEVDDEILAELPEPQGLGLQVALLRRTPASGATDQRVVGTALLTVLGKLADKRPVLLAVDDLQWLDGPSLQVVQFAARRLRGPVGLVLSVRTEAGTQASAPRLPDSSQLRSLRIGPLGSSALHRLLKERTGRAYTRPALLRILDVSGGNPFFALELARAVGPDASWEALTRLPGKLADILDARIEGLDPEVREALLAVAALAEPGVELLERLLGSRATALLEEAEHLQVVEIEAGRIRFTHPLLAARVYGTAPAAQRRAVHRQLASMVPTTEEQARHLALGALRASRETVDALDRASGQARARGAPAAAAELLDLALRLGADEPGRRIKLAEHLLDAGDLPRARRLLEEVITTLPPGLDRAEALFLLGSLHSHGHGYLQAAELMQRALGDASDDRRMRARIGVGLTVVLVDMGRVAEAETHAEAALSDAEGLRDGGLLAQALVYRAGCRFIQGRGLDEAALDRALALEDPSRRVPILRPIILAALLRMWSGKLDEASEALLSARERCIERGEENDLLTFAYSAVAVECFRGDFESARRIADDALERAEQQDTEGGRARALAAVAAVSAHLGRVATARRAADESLALFERTGFVHGSFWAGGTLGFLELSLGDNEAAADRLGPLTSLAMSMGMREPMITPFAADATEALVAVNRLKEAAAATDWLETCGKRFDRAWARAVGARCRGLLLAAQGDLPAAVEAVGQALAHHERLPMPFERARTLLLAGQLQRRSRRPLAARALLEEALGAFEHMGTVLWAQRARTELERLGLRRGAGEQLTPSEERVAGLAAGGMTNREVAATLFISPKTVEANLARIYGKLGIRSRAELGRRMSEHPGRPPAPDP